MRRRLRNLEPEDLLALTAVERRAALRRPGRRPSRDVVATLVADSERQLAEDPVRALESAHLAIAAVWRRTAAVLEPPQRLEALAAAAWLSCAEARLRLGQDELAELALAHAEWLISPSARGRKLVARLGLTRAQVLLARGDLGGADFWLDRAMQTFGKAGCPAMVTFCRLVRIVLWSEFLGTHDAPDLAAARFDEPRREGVEQIAPGLVADLERRLDRGEPRQTVLAALAAERWRFEAPAAGHAEPLGYTRER